LFAVASFSQNNDGIYFSPDSGATWTSISPPNISWDAVATSADGIDLVAVTSGDRIYTAQATSTTGLAAGTAGLLAGAQGAALELIYIGNGQYLEMSQQGTIAVQ
jgi:hypothetical protein